MNYEQIINNIKKSPIKYCKNNKKYYNQEFAIFLNLTILNNQLEINLAAEEKEKLLYFTREQYLNNLTADQISPGLISWLQTLDYLSKDEIKDLLQNYTRLDVLLDPDDLWYCLNFTE